MNYLTQLWAALDGRLIVLAVLTLVDFILGVIVSLFVLKDFKWERLNHYLLTDVLPIFAWIGVVVVANIPAEFVPSGIILVIPDAVYATVFIGILASILGSVKEMGVLTAGFEKIGI